MSDLRSTPAAGGLSRAASARARPFEALALAAMLAASCAMPATASARWFTAEIIVFDDLQNEGLHAEHWPEDPGEPSLRNAIELTRPLESELLDGGIHAYRLVGPSDLSLKAVWNRLRRSARYRPLLHLGWRLRGVSRGAARPAHVSRSLGGSEAGAAEGVGDERPAVHGTVKVSMARYLQVDVDLLYVRPAGDGSSAPDAASDTAPNAAPDAAPTRLRLTSERRMRFGELHYIDHPVFGVLVLLTPL